MTYVPDGGLRLYRLSGEDFDAIIYATSKDDACRLFASEEGLDADDVLTEVTQVRAARGVLLSRF